MIIDIDNKKGSCSLILFILSVCIVTFLYLTMADKYFKKVNNVTYNQETGVVVPNIITTGQQKSFLDSTKKRLHDMERQQQEMSDKIMDGFDEENYR